MTTLRCDVLVLGSSLGGLVAATYLARSGLRVIVVEEETHTKRPPLMREPFLLSGLEPSGPVQRVLRELGVPLIHQRELRRETPPVQLLLPGARIDLHRDAGAMAEEIDAHGLARRAVAAAWLERVDAAAERARAGLWEEPPPPSGRAGTLGGVATRARAPRLSAPVRVEASLPAPPEQLGVLVDALLAGLSGLDEGARTPAAPLLIRTAREGEFRVPHGGAPFTELLRRRLRALHGNIWEVDEFALVEQHNEPGIELARGALFGRALVLAAPREPLRRWLERSSGGASWLRSGTPVVPHPPALVRAERRRVPSGLASRAVVCDGGPSGMYRIALTRDPGHDEIEWLALSGPGAAARPPESPLGALAPFSDEGYVPVDPGPTPQWDLDAADLSFASPAPPPPLRHRVPVASVGPELAPGLGFEGEVLLARRAALRLAHRMGARRAV